MRWKLISVVLCSFLVHCCGGSGGDPCQDVTCDTPPADVCKDDSTLVEFQAEGSCQHNSGECLYPSSEKDCLNGCQNDQCMVEGQVWGYVSVVELNDTISWDPAIEAYFTVEPHFRHSLPHHLPLFLPEIDRSGDCQLYSDVGKRADLCDPPCDPDQKCMYEGDNIFCQDLPAHYSVGTLTLEGLKTDCQIEPDEFDRYRSSDLPEDLFDEGISLTAKTSGGQLEPLSLSTPGVATLELENAILDLQPDQAVEISWTPAVADTRVMLILQTGMHDPALPAATLICDVPDAQGRIDIDVSLINGFLERHFIMQKFSRIIRYTREIQAPYGLDIEFIVGSSRGLDLMFP